MKLRILMILLCWSGIACQNSAHENEIAFERAKWQTKTGDDYPYRNRMLVDLISSDTLKRLNKQQLVEMLGAPDRIDNNYLFYLVEQQRAQFFTLHTKNMVVKLSKDDTVEWVKIHE
jgi:hypothetical protein